MKINQKVDFKTYRSWDGINSSCLGDFKRSPMHYLYTKNNPKDSTAMKLGRAFHELVLEPDEYAKNYAVTPKIDRRTKAGKAEYAEWIAGAGEREFLSHEEHKKILNMALNFDNHPTAKKLIDGKREISTQFSLDGILCKARADVVYDDTFLVDLKTTRDASPESFMKSVYNFGYYRQAAFYLEAFKRTEFIFVAVESEPPYAIGIYQVPKEMLEFGLIEARILVREMDQCIKENCFPGYSKRIEMMDTPNWMLNRLEQYNEDKGDLHEH